MTKIVCLDSFPADTGDVNWDRVKTLGRLTLYPNTLPDQIVERAANADVVLTNKVRLDAVTLAQLPKLRMIGVLATGYDIIDLAAATEQRITVCNVPGYSTAAAAQLSIALLLELTHGAGAHSAAVHTGEWARQPAFAYWRQPLVELDGKTMAILGFGAIGQRVGAIVQALGMKVITPALPGRERTDRMPLDEALATADVISVHCPLTPGTRGIIGRDNIANMKPGVLIVNAGRGPLVDEHAVREALDVGHIGGFAADVLSVEPPAANHPLFNAPRTVLTPHIGWAALAARQRLIDWTAESIEAFLHGAPIRVVAGPGFNA